MKIEVEFRNDIHQEPFKKGQRGFVVGFVQGGDSRPYAVVISGQDMGFVSPYELIVKS